MADALPAAPDPGLLALVRGVPRGRALALGPVPAGLAARFGRVFAVGLDPAALPAARAAGGAGLRVGRGDPCALPFGDKSFDLVWSQGVAEAVDDLDLHLDEARRVLRPGGQLCLEAAVAPPDPADDDALHALLQAETPSPGRLYPAALWPELLDARGLLLEQRVAWTALRPLRAPAALALAARLPPSTARALGLRAQGDGLLLSLEGLRLSARRPDAGARPPGAPRNSG